MVTNQDVDRLEFRYLKEETVIYRDQEQQIHFLTRDQQQ